MAKLPQFAKALVFMEKAMAGVINGIEKPGLFPNLVCSIGQRRGITCPNYAQI
ncbi:MAG: hypothetical protein WA782_03415 [Sulfitobacter sp.]